MDRPCGNSCSMSNESSSPHLREAKEGSPLEAEDQVEGLTEPQEYYQIAKASWCPSNSALAPAAHDPCTGFWCRSGRNIFSLPVTSLEPINFGSQPPGQDGCASILLLGWFLLFSVSFPQLLGLSVDSTRSEPKNSSTFPQWYLVWRILLCWLKTGQMLAKTHPMQISGNVLFCVCVCAYTLWVWEGYWWADPSIWHCHRSCREEQQSFGVFSWTLLTRVIAICQVHDQMSSFPTVQWIVQKI